MTTTVTKDDLAAQSTDNGQAVSDTTKYTGEFEGTFTGTLVGNATTAKELEKPYNFTLSGDATGTVAVNASSVILETTVNQATHADTADFAGKTNLAARSTLADMANTAEFAYRAGKLSKLFVNITGACVGSGSATDSDTIDINIDNINVAELFVVGALPEEKANTSRIYVDISNRHFWIYNNDTAKWYDCFEQLETELDNHELRITDLEKLDLSNRVTSLETRANANDVTVADFEKRITANTTELADHESRITANETAKNDHETRIATAESDIDNLETRVTANENNIKTNTDNISSIDARVTTTEANVTKLDQRVDNIETSTDVGALAAKITSIEKKNTEQDTAIQTNADAISAEVSDRTTADTALETKISDEAKAREDADTALETKISDEAKAREDADTALATSVKNDIQSKLDALETKNTEQDTSIKANADAIAENKTACDNANTALDARVTNIENGYVTLDSEQTITGAKTFDIIIKSPTPPTSASGTEVVTAEWVRANKKQGGDADYVASLTASDDFFRRPALFECDKRSVTLPAKLEVKINGTIYKTTETHTISISDFGTQAGKDFYIYACVPAEEDSTEPDFVISQNSTVPTGYTAENSRKIGGFHTLCLSVGTLQNVDPLIKSSTSVAHKLSGYVTGDILPASRWDLWHRPKVSPEGYVYCGPDNGCDVWVSIYLLSWDGSKLVSKYNAVTADGGSSKVWHGELFSDAMQAIGGRLPYRREFARFSFGSNEATNIYGSADKTYTGGHTDTSSRRMISNIGCEDCCGYLWQWSEELGFYGGSGWSASTYSSSVDPISRGNTYGGLYRLLLGGGWPDGSSCGSRSADCSAVSSSVYAYVGGRGASEPLHRDALNATGYPV